MTPPIKTRGTNTKSIRGILNNYAPKNGVQYYKDLAGNIKQVTHVYNAS